MNYTPILLTPRDEWRIAGLNDESIVPTYPVMIYNHTEFIDVPNDLVMGGSYTKFYDTPHYFARTAWFERNVLPYPLDTPSFVVRYGVFLWDRFNLSVYTDVSPGAQYTDVYVFKRTNTLNTEPPRCVGRIEFKRDSINLTEKI